MHASVLKQEVFSLSLGQFLLIILSTCRNFYDDRKAETWPKDPVLLNRSCA